MKSIDSNPISQKMLIKHKSKDLEEEIYAKRAKITGRR